MAKKRREARRRRPTKGVGASTAAAAGNAAGAGAAIGAGAFDTASQQILARPRRNLSAAVQATDGVTNPPAPTATAGFPSPLPLPTMPGGVVGMTPTPPPADLNLTSTPPEVRVQPSPQAESIFAGEGRLIADADVLRGPQTVHAELLERLAAIEAILPQLPGLGHNNPPEPIAPITITNVEQIKLDVTFVAGLPPVPNEVPTRVGQVYARLKKYAEEVRFWILTAGAIGGAAIATWRQFGEELTSASDLISEWIKLLMHLT